MRDRIQGKEKEEMIDLYMTNWIYFFIEYWLSQEKPRLGTRPHLTVICGEVISLIPFTAPYAADHVPNM
jgi:hypothetical protein